MKYGDGTEIHESALINEKVTIGRKCVIGANVVIMNNTTIGDDVRIHPGAVIGSDGFQFRHVLGRLVRVPQLGGVEIHDGVEIQSNTCVDRGTGLVSTVIGKDTKIDNLVHIAHDVHIGERCLIAAQAMIAGETKIGNDVWIGPGAVISDKITIGDKSFITLGSVVTKDVSPGQHVTGNFAIDHGKFIENLKKIR